MASCSGSTDASHCNVSHLPERVTLCTHHMLSSLRMRPMRNFVSRLSAYLCWADPTPAVLQAFDDLLLLKSGGLVTYHGSLGKNSCRLIEYFQVQPACLSSPGSRAAPSALGFTQVCLETKASAADVGLMLWLCDRRGSSVHADKGVGRRASRACPRWRRASTRRPGCCRSARLAWSPPLASTSARSTATAPSMSMSPLH